MSKVLIGLKVTNYDKCFIIKTHKMLKPVELNSTGFITVSIMINALRQAQRPIF
jgi:hypothetical protein